MQADDHSRLHRSYVVCNVVNKDYCSVTNCNSSAPNKRVSSRISFHKIPKQKQSHLRIVWKRFIQRGKPRNYTVSDNAKICSNHFRSSDLITTLTGKRILAKNAVPFEPVKSSCWERGRSENPRRIVLLWGRSKHVQVPSCFLQQPASVPPTFLIWYKPPP